MQFGCGGGHNGDPASEVRAACIRGKTEVRRRQVRIGGQVVSMPGGQLLQRGFCFRGQRHQVQGALDLGGHRR
jgi:hypothetical protein